MNTEASLTRAMAIITHPLKHTNVLMERRAAFDYGITKFCKEAGFDEEDEKAMAEMLLKIADQNFNNKSTFVGHPGIVGGNMSAMTNPMGTPGGMKPPAAGAAATPAAPAQSPGFFGTLGQWGGRLAKGITTPIKDFANGLSEGFDNKSPVSDAPLTQATANDTLENTRKKWEQSYYAAYGMHGNAERAAARVGAEFGSPDATKWLHNKFSTPAGPPSQTAPQAAPNLMVDQNQAPAAPAQAPNSVASNPVGPGSPQYGLNAMKDTIPGASGAAGGSGPAGMKGPTSEVAPPAQNQPPPAAPVSKPVVKPDPGAAAHVQGTDYDTVMNPESGGYKTVPRAGGGQPGAPTQSPGDTQPGMGGRPQMAPRPPVANPFEGWADASKQNAATRGATAGKGQIIAGDDLADKDTDARVAMSAKMHGQVHEPYVAPTEAPAPVPTATPTQQGLAANDKKNQAANYKMGPVEE